MNFSINQIQMRYIASSLPWDKETNILNDERKGARHHIQSIIYRFYSLCQNGAT